MSHLLVESTSLRVWDNMKIRNILILALFVILNLNFIHGQSLQFYGDFEPGTMIIAKGDPVERARINDQKLKIDDDGIFCFGFDAKQTGSQILNIKFKEGKVLLKKIDLANETEDVFNKARNLAQKFNIKLELPGIFPILRNRICPYISRNAIIVRVNGGVAPCYNFLHNHRVYVNNHERDVKEITFGNLQEESLEDIVQGKNYHNFRKILLDISKNIPWSGDCLYSTRGCFFVSNNDTDCYGNSPGCNECLYSVGLVNCIF